MAELICICGESGSGKTSSVRNLDPKSTFIISTTGKRPGIKGAAKKYPNFVIENKVPSGNFYTTSNIDQINKVLKVVDSHMKDIKVVVIDD